MTYFIRRSPGVSFGSGGATPPRSSITQYIKAQRPQRVVVPRAIFTLNSGRFRPVLERRLLAFSRATRGTRTLPRTFQGFAGGIREVEETLEAARQAAVDADIMARELTPAEVSELATQAVYKSWGETQARLGMPVSYGTFAVNAAYTYVRQTTSGLANAAALGNWLSSVSDITASAGGQIAYYERMATSYVGGNYGQLIDLGRTFRGAYERVGGSVLTLASSAAESVESGVMSLVGDAMREKPDWLTEDLVGNAYGAIRQGIAAGAAGNIGGLIEAIGGGLVAVAAATGPGAPWVALAGGLVMLGGFVASIFGADDTPPPPGPFRINGEHWGTTKLLYAASIDGESATPIQGLLNDGMTVNGDAHTGETMIRPYPGWSGAGRMISRTWPHAMRAVDMFDRRDLLRNDRVLEWVETGRGITFDGVEYTPANLHSIVQVQDPFTKFAGAMATSPAPWPTGASSDWPVGGAIRWDDRFWEQPIYRAAYVAAAALGGCPPFTSYGYKFEPRIGRGYWAAGSQFYDTGIGGRVETEIAGRGSIWWIPWGVHWDVSGRQMLLIPPRRVPYHLQGARASNHDFPGFRQWLFYGNVVRDNVRCEFDPELRDCLPTYMRSSGVSAETFRTGIQDNPIARAMTLEEFFRDWYGRDYDEDEPRTWFVHETPPLISGEPIVPGSSVLPGMILPSLPRGIVIPESVVRSWSEPKSEPEGWSTGKKVAVGASVVGIPLAVYYLGKKMKWW